MTRLVFLLRIEILKVEWGLEKLSHIYHLQVFLFVVVVVKHLYLYLKMHVLYFVAVVAASAIAGKITSPESLANDLHSFSNPPTIKVTNLPDSTESSNSEPDEISSTIDGFPAIQKGEILFCDTDNLDTDGIYPGSFTYQDDITPEEMAKVAMRNYDPNFQSLVKKVYFSYLFCFLFFLLNHIYKSDILVSGFNFGTGSSREQAATSLLYSGISLIIAGSLSETFKRNAINNGLLCLESPSLVQDLRNAFPTNGSEPGKKLTNRTKWYASVDYLKGTVIVSVDGKVTKEYRIPVVGQAAQELIVCGGLEKWVKNKIH